jgi:hypothetical protein
MALSAAVLQAALEVAFVQTAGMVDNAAMEHLAQAIAETVIAHITANAVVTVAAGIPVTCGAVQGATTATGTGTVA